MKVEGWLISYQLSKTLVQGNKPSNQPTYLQRLLTLRMTQLSARVSREPSRVGIRVPRDCSDTSPRKLWGSISLSLFHRSAAPKKPTSFHDYVEESGSIILRRCAGAKVARDITMRKRSERALATAARRQKALFQLADELHRAVSMDEVQNAALDAILDALQCNRASILLCDETGIMRFS